MAKDAIDQEIEAIRKLPPKERLRRLKELEDKRRRLEEETKKIKEESVNEIKLDQMLEEIEVPKQESIEVEKLFGRRGVDVDLEVDEEQLRAARKGGPDYAKSIKDVTGPQLPSDNRDMYIRGNTAELREAVEEAENSAAYKAAAHGEAATNSQHYKSSSEEVTEGLLSSARLEKSMRRDL
ncbi:hypothetical protein KY362_02755 [Candidatus Woesearchaeota archaeon]|nr:hypothetical protein [Candidatus Woesearchaeota archaeon]